MLIKIEEDEELKDIEITIRCPHNNNKVKELLAHLEIINQKIIANKRGEMYILEARDILYIEIIDKHSYIYTVHGMYESMLKLYELEERLADVDFFRAGKSLVLNFQKIKILKPDLDGRILVTMQNGDKRMISRQYAISIKRRLGIMK